MALPEKKITESQMSANGVIAAPDKLEGTAAENKAVFDRMIRAVVSVNLNALIDELSAMLTGDGTNAPVLSGEIKGIRLNADGVIEVTTDGTSWEATGSSGHIILDGTGTVLPQRGRMRFANCEVTDTDGVTVVDGVRGPDGPRGPQGIQGIQGPDGKVFLPSIGNDGMLTWTLENPSGYVPSPRNIRGPQGVQGPQGSAGPQGVAGIQGATGAVGPTGPQGMKGDTGSTGERGPEGVQGVPGPEGIQGAKGEPGPQGVPGPSGPQGVQGPQGIPGAKGANGADGRDFVIRGMCASLAALMAAHPAGSAGDAYAVGTAAENTVYLWDTDESLWEDIGGIRGPQGETGPQGTQGPQGAQGMQGASGAAGERGPEGKQGPQGVQGPKGDTGGKGEPGPVGPQGPTGSAGATGPQGEQGPAGPQGTQGIQGERGMQGPEGPQGPIGPQGQPGEDANTAALEAALNAHTGNTTVHVTQAERAVWNGAKVTAEAAQSTANAAQSTANAALPKAGGTMSGQLTAGGGQAVGTAQVRNIYAGTADLSAGLSALATGAIYFVYE